ncbi:hypothetical protein SAMN04489841_2996 [Natrinema salaciae]|uniref:Uncharacterized protein n=1 Tax=Natrinema salaciae TaxID=1186196 RepID=A0A1H9LKC5_9EURY|nr:hypothetical protein SAMN04489841_2996 [Natrinema salaciae]
MYSYPVEENPVTRFILGLAVIIGMSHGAQAAMIVFTSIGVPYANWMGAIVGSLAVFVTFAAIYTYYYPSHSAD